MTVFAIFVDPYTTPSAPSISQTMSVGGKTVHMVAKGSASYSATNEGNDILINGHENCFVERKGKLQKVHVPFKDEAHLLRIINKIVAAVGRRVDESQPMVDARMLDGSRFNAAIRPVGVDGPLVSIRKFSKNKLGLHKLVEFGAITQNMAEVLATRSFPGTRTDAEFMKGRYSGDQFAHAPWLGDYYRKVAEGHGVNPAGKYYCAGLADFPGDPTAWIDGRGDVERVAREKGYKVSGMVEYQPGERSLAGAELRIDVLIAAHRAFL